MEALTVVVHWLHVLGAIFWFGSTLVGSFIVIPAVQRLPLRVQRDFGEAYGAVALRIVPIVAGLTIVLGLLRGTVFGPLKGFDALLGTAYGITFVVGFLAAVGTFAWGKLQIEPAIRELYADEAAWSGDQPPADFGPKLSRVKRVSIIELGGFFLVFTAMILMRFGL